MPVKSANLHFNEQGTPVSSDFGDVYFSNDDGLKESQYVFLQHNDIPARWATHNRPEFVILETGFGTGLNFLLTWAAFRQVTTEQQFRLHFISTEKFPIARSDLQSALQSWPELALLSDALLDQYPMHESGCHRLLFDNGDIILDLWIGDILDSLPKLSSPSDGLVDAWYLDGFAPSKNPQMWTDELFRQMCRLSRNECTVATFTAAGVVKRGLISAGFNVTKAPGFGRKRDMLQGIWQPKLPPTPRMRKLWLERHLGPWQRSALNAARSPDGQPSEQPISIIGAGIAGASLALALTELGKTVTLYWQDKEPAQGASGNISGGFYPLLTADHSIQAQFYTLAFQFALNRYRQLMSAGYVFDHDFCGVYFPSFREPVAKRQQNLLDKDVWSHDLVHYVPAQQASSLVGLHMPYEGLFIPNGGWINPPSLVRAYLDKAKSTGLLQLLPNHQLQSLQSDNGWRLHWQDGSSSFAQSVIIANGHQSRTLPELQELPLSITRGQVEYVPSQGAISKVKRVVCHKGYLTPACNGFHALGSTYIKDDDSVRYRMEEQHMNIATLQSALQQCDWVNGIPTIEHGRAAIRCTTPDHLPLVGAVPDIAAQKVQYAELSKKKQPQNNSPIELRGLYMFTGLGSRGLCTAPILAELLASQICGKPLPLSTDMQAMVSPNRFLIRDLIRGKI
ncbi:MAG: bifunctional tRNA (5-methylaminomethyl-2-thiouridine)(34)-methyltransferase MnmD/FAD-dependent 5-carboxymethylaminomethyl-2-thiouridine(34) oxidoreductase MnmC [Aestuariibacter sp.]